MGSPKVSVIIPAYNAEEFLSPCIDSLRDQTLHEIEIIIVNDASSDNSQTLIDHYCALDSRIRSITNKENKGPFLSRLNGINSCSGIYIAFVDADDTVEPAAYEVMYNKAIEENFDIIGCRIHRIVNDTVDRQYLRNVIANRNIYGSDILKNLLLEKIPNSFWNKVYHARIIEAVVNDRLFNEARENIEKNAIKLLIEDQFFNFFAAYYSRSYYMVEDRLYNYIYRDTSLCAEKNEERMNLWSKSAMHNVFHFEKFLLKKGVATDYEAEMNEMKHRLVVKRKRRVLSLFSDEVRLNRTLFDETVDDLARYVDKSYIFQHVVDGAVLEIAQLKREKEELLKSKRVMQEELALMRRHPESKRGFFIIPKKIVKVLRKWLQGNLR